VHFASTQNTSRAKRECRNILEITYAQETHKSQLAEIQDTVEQNQSNPPHHQTNHSAISHEGVGWYHSGIGKAHSKKPSFIPQRMREPAVATRWDREPAAHQALLLEKRKGLGQSTTAGAQFGSVNNDGGTR